MKVYTHPTIVTRAGNCIVKFYDESKSGTETMPDCIEDIGDVEEGFDIDLGAPYLPDCTLKLHNVNNYVLGTLLDTYTLEFSITVNNEYYFYGVVDFERSGAKGIETASTLLGTVTIKGSHLFSKLQAVSLTEVSDAISSTSDPLSNSIYMRQIFRVIAQKSGLYWTTFSDVSLLLKRLFYFYDDINNEEIEKYLDEVVITKSQLLVTTSDTVFAGFLQRKIDNLFDLLSILCKDFFLYPSIFYDGTNFKLRIMEKDAGYPISGLTVKKSEPYKKYFLRKLTTSLVEMPLTVNKNNIYYSDELTEKTIGDDVKLVLNFTNIDTVDGLNPTGSGTLNQTPSNITTTGNDVNGGAGTALITVSGTTTEFKYNYKLGNTFYGCTVQSGTVNYTNTSVITNSAGVYLTHNKIYLYWAWAGDIGLINEVRNYRFTVGSGYDRYDSFAQAMHELYKQIYYDNDNWRNIDVVGLGATHSVSNKLLHLMPGSTFTHFSQFHFIHSVRKSLTKNETEITAIVLD